MTTTQAQLTRDLTLAGTLQTPHLIEAFRTVNRTDFVPDAYREHAHRDTALPIPDDQTISQPTVVAFMLELLQPQPGDRVLDVGSGCGWTTTLLAYAVMPDGWVIGVERSGELVRYGRDNLGKYHLDNAAIQETGETLGASGHAPFDRILVSAAADNLPQTLLEQLVPGGTLVLPIGDAVWQVGKQESGSLQVQQYGGFAFVPLHT